MTSERPGNQDILAYNRHARDRQVERGNRWTVPVGPDEVARARRGDWRIVLAPPSRSPPIGSRPWRGSTCSVSPAG